jgi:peroxiredoxin
MRLKPGEPAPDFDVRDADDHTIRLADHRGRKVLVSFFRYASCPYCNLRVHEMLGRAPGWSTRGLDVIAFFESPAESVRARVGQQAAAFPIVPDPQREVYARYGVEASWAGFAAGLVRPRGLVAMAKGFLPGKMEGEVSLLPADFLVDESGTVRTAFYSSNIVDHLPFDAIEAFVAV